MRNRPDNDADDVQIVPVPLDRWTRERLAWLARIAGGQPVTLAGALLRDLLIEDEACNDRPLGPLN